MAAVPRRKRLRTPSEHGGRFYAGRQDNAASGKASTRVPAPLTAGTSTGKGVGTVPAPLTGGISTTPPATTRPSDIPTMLGMGPVAGTAPVQVPTSTAPTISAQVTEGDAYWAQQPPAVQALRYMPQGPEKDALALKLSNQGYSIDTQIMVMGWDPQMTMAAREGFGYTWVPSYGQPAITVQPGISDPYMSSNYNPASPPAGSIPVSLAFAVGTIQESVGAHTGYNLIKSAHKKQEAGVLRPASCALRSIGPLECRLCWRTLCSRSKPSPTRGADWFQQDW